MTRATRRARPQLSQRACRQAYELGKAPTRASQSAYGKQRLLYLESTPSDSSCLPLFSKAKAGRCHRHPQPPGPCSSSGHGPRVLAMAAKDEGQHWHSTWHTPASLTGQFESAPGAARCTWQPASRRGRQIPQTWPLSPLGPAAARWRAHPPAVQHLCQQAWLDKQKSSAGLCRACADRAMPGQPSSPKVHNVTHHLRAPALHGADAILEVLVLTLACVLSHSVAPFSVELRVRHARSSHAPRKAAVSEDTLQSHLVCHRRAEVSSHSAATKVDVHLSACTPCTSAHANSSQ